MSHLQGYDPSCLRELMLEILGRSAPYGNTGLQVSLFLLKVYWYFVLHSSFQIFWRVSNFLQILDRNWGAGWHLLSLLLATKPSQRIRYAVKQNCQLKVCIISSPVLLYLAEIMSCTYVKILERKNFSGMKEFQK